LIAKGLTFLEKSKRLQVPERSRVKVGVTGGICEVSFEITSLTRIASGSGASFPEVLETAATATDPAMNPRLENIRPL
jgi:hypothetical protein